MPQLPPPQGFAPTGDATLSRAVVPLQRSCMQLALEQTLSIATADSESQLLARTLAAACEVSGARFAAALEPDGGLRVHGDPALAVSLSGLDPGALPQPPADVSEALRGTRSQSRGNASSALL